MSSYEIPDDPPEGFTLVDFARGRPEPNFNTHVGNMYVKRGEKGTRDEFVLAIRVQQNMCNPAGGLHGGMMMTVADLRHQRGSAFRRALCKRNRVCLSRSGRERQCKQDGDCFEHFVFLHMSSRFCG